MDDPISRHAAIKVADAIWSVTGDKNVAKVWDQLKDLPSAQLEQQWIPCSERLPEEDNFYNTHGYNKSSKYVMVTVILHENRFGFSKIVRVGRYDYQQKKWVILSCPEWNKIIAWMPLPEPYKGE